MNRYWWNFT